MCAELFGPRRLFAPLKLSQPMAAARLWFSARQGASRQCATHHLLLEEVLGKVDDAQHGAVFTDCSCNPRIRRSSVGGRSWRGFHPSQPQYVQQRLAASVGHGARTLDAHCQLLGRQLPLWSVTPNVSAASKTLRLATRAATTANIAA